MSVKKSTQKKSDTPKATRTGKPSPQKQHSGKRGRSAGPPRAVSPARYAVGIGASAGGLEALRSLFGNLKSANTLSIIVVQHLAPQHRSRLVELIAQTTSLTVKEVTSGETLAAGTVYITPPAADLEIRDGALQLYKPSGQVGPKPNIDRFFESLANSFQDNAIGIILSGTGSDGARGIRAIKASGGVTICQLPETSKYDGMPRAAKQTGAVDLELPPEQIARQLELFDQYALRDEGERRLQHYLPPQDPYATILKAVQKTSRVSFRDYKQSTIRRRIERRVVATRCSSVEEYADYIRSHPEEPQALFQDILISVTSFFRDPGAYDDLAANLARRIAEKEPNGIVRCWVVGCASGEEAYSVAILIGEAIERQKKPLTVQVFATDIDDQAMATARKGVYSSSAVSDLPAPLRNKYFETLHDTVRVKDFLRDQIVFARHDVTQDPPFLKLDLVSCRNVLIYFSARLQEQVLNTFHFALENRGLLFLGKSEATSVAGALFETVGNNSKIFTRVNTKGELPRGYSRLELNRETLLATQDRASTSGLPLMNSLVAGFAPNSALVDEHYRIRHLYGKANRYLNLPQGKPSTDITKLVAGPVSAELTALLHAAEKNQLTVRGKKRHSVVADGEPVTLQLSVVPVSLEGPPEFFVCFTELQAEAANPNEGSSSYAHLPLQEQVRKLEQDLAVAREHLQSVLEEHETASEELQALNEELQSSNEELQSTNEELETTNEELQSTNEELTTLNQEVNVRSAELLALSQRLQAIHNAIYYPLLIVDMKLRLLDYNPAARYLFRVTDGDRGHSLRGSGIPPEFAQVLDIIADCLQKGRDTKVQLVIGAKQYEVRVQLYKGNRDEFEGAVVSFVDNTELMRALDESRRHQEQLSSILENTPAFVTMKDTTGAYTYVNRRFAEFIALAPESIIGRTDEELFGELAGHRMRDRDFEVLKTRKPVRVEEVVPAETGTHHWLSSKFPLLGERRRPYSVCTVSLDITESVAYRSQLEVFRRVVSAATSGIALFEANDARYQATLISPEFAQKLGMASEHYAGVELEDVLQALYGAMPGLQPAEMSARIRGSTSETFNLNLAERSGGEDWIEMRTASLQFGEEGPRYLVLTLFDVNERVQTQRVLEAQQEEVDKFSKLASLGEVAAGISHEINTPLNVITTKSDLLRRLSDRQKLDQPKAHRLADEIDGMVQNIARVISGLKSLSGMDSEHKNTHDMVSLVHEAASICDFRLRRSGVKLTVSVPPTPVLVECYPVQIVQIMINLINNAVDAVSEYRERWVRVEIGVVGPSAVVKVTDSGKGIDPAIAEKVMTPFFTTKQDRSGTGLGLSISRNIALHHGGNLVLDGSATHTTFCLTIPSTKEV